MVFSREVPRAVEVLTAAAAASSPSPSPPPHRPVLLRGKPRSRLPVPPLRTWANQRLVRCVDGAGDNASPAPAAPPAPLPTFSPSEPPAGRTPSGPRDDRFERIRAKLMDHLREAADRIELPAAAASASAPGDETRHKGDPAAEVPVEDSEDDSNESHNAAATPSAAVSVAATPPPAAEELPWNLRTRRSAQASNGWHHSSPVPPPLPLAKAASRLRSGAPERREATLRRRRPRFSVPLTKEEIDEDVYAFTGRLAARRPKKRPRAVQRQLDMLFPGLYLSEVTADMYQVADQPPPPPS